MKPLWHWGLASAALLALLAGPAAAQRNRRGPPMPSMNDFPTATAQPAKTPVPISQGPLVLHAETRVVDIEVTVASAAGEPVNDLKKSDFTIRDNGKTRKVTIFSFNPGAAASPAAPPAPAGRPGAAFSNERQPPIPPQHSAVMLLDGFNGWFSDYVSARQAVVDMLSRIPADERVAVYVISRYDGLLLLQDYTTDRARIRQAIGRFTPSGLCAASGRNSGQTAQARSASASGSASLNPADAPAVAQGSATSADSMQSVPYMPASAGYDASGDAEARAIEAANTTSPCVDADRNKEALLQNAVDAVQIAFMALAQNLGQQPGRKTVFWMTGGFPPTWLNNTGHRDNSTMWKKTFTALNAANIAVDAVDTHGIDGPPRMWGAGGKTTLEHFSDATGGQFFINRTNLADALVAGVAASRASYTLGFYLGKLDGKFHNLTIAVDRPGLTLAYRHGYNAQDQAQRLKDQKKLDLRTVLLDPANQSGVGINADVQLTHGQPRGKLLVKLNLDPATLSVTPNGDKWNGEVQELFYEFNATGAQVGHQAVTKRFQMTAVGRRQVSKDGLNLPETLACPAAATRLTVVVRDSTSGHIGTLSLPLPQPPAAASAAAK